MFSIADVLNKVQHAQHTVEIYLDNTNAVRVLDLMAEIAREEGKEVFDRSITEDSPLELLRKELDSIRDNSISVTFRALSKQDVAAIRAKVVKDNPIPTGIGEDERAMHEEDRDAALQQHLLSLATIKVVNNFDGGSEANSLSFEDYKNLYQGLSAAQWEALVSGYLIAQEAGTVAADALSDPTFRRDAPGGQM